MRSKSERLESVRGRVARGEYRVDSHRVAAAMLERIGANVVDRATSTSSKVVVP